MDLVYAYANARVKAMKSKLFTQGKTRELLDVASIPELVELLEESGYRDAFVSESQRSQGMALVMRALKRHWEGVVQKVTRLTPARDRPFLEMFLREYEVQSLTALLASASTGVPLQDTDLMVVSDRSRALLARLMQKEGVMGVVNGLRGTDYAKPLAAALPEYERTKDFRVLARTLSADHFNRFLKMAGAKREPLVERLVKWRIELLDLMLLLRVKRANPAQDASPFFIHRETPLLRELNALKEFPKVLERLKGLSPSLVPSVDEALKTRSLVPVEIALERRFYEKVLRALRVGVLDFATVLGFLYLEEVEVGSIRKIAYAKQYGFSNELKSMLFGFSNAS